MGSYLPRQVRLWAGPAFAGSALLAIVLTGCAGSQEVQTGIVTPAVDAAQGQTPFAAGEAAAYVLRPGDTVSVDVFGEEQLSRPRLLIASDGRVALPLIGSLILAGRSLPDAAALIEELYERRYLRSPTVALNVVEYGSHLVTVEGSVTSPGLYEFTPGTRLSGAIALASGTSRTAELGDVAIFRQTEETLQAAKFDYAQVRAGRMVDPVLQPGDRVVVGTDRLSQAWQDALRAIPAFGLFTNL